MRHDLLVATCHEQIVGVLDGQRTEYQSFCVKLIHLT